MIHPVDSPFTRPSRVVSSITMYNVRPSVRPGRVRPTIHRRSRRGGSRCRPRRPGGTRRCHAADPHPSFDVDAETVGVALGSEVGEHAWGADAAVGFGGKREQPRPGRLAHDEGRSVGQKARPLGRASPVATTRTKPPGSTRPMAPSIAVSSPGRGRHSHGRRGRRRGRWSTRRGRSGQMWRPPAPARRRGRPSHRRGWTPRASRRAASPARRRARPRPPRRRRRPRPRSTPGLPVRR